MISSSRLASHCLHGDICDEIERFLGGHYIVVVVSYAVDESAESDVGVTQLGDPLISQLSPYRNEVFQLSC